MNIKSLSAEQRAISFERKRASPPEERELRIHQVDVVRPESRAAQLLYAYVRGVPRKVLEQTFCPHKHHDLRHRMERKAKRHGIAIDGLMEWLAQ